jgi:hypothetical protein
VSFSLFTLIGVTLSLAFVKSAEVWRNVSNSSDSALNLRKARTLLTPDLQRTSFANIRTLTGPTSLGPIDGDAICFLSAVDPATGLAVRKSDGTLFWQRNILYYLVVPDNHSATFGVDCTGSADANGYEENCPHKILIRKIIDAGTPTDPADEATEEVLLTTSQISTYLTRPTGFNTSNMNGEPGLADIRLAANFLLTFRADLAPDTQWQREVRILCSAVKIRTAERELSIGNTPLSQTKFVRVLRLSLFPGLP